MKLGVFRFVASLECLNKLPGLVQHIDGGPQWHLFNITNATGSWLESVSMLLGVGGASTFWSNRNDRPLA